MQLDEEVGKLASATPVMISKSLECFIQVLLDESCKTVREAGARKLTAGHLKLMINTNPSFDFLRELTESIADLPSASGAGPSKARKASSANASAAGKGKGNGNRGDEGVETWAKGEQERLRSEGGSMAPGWRGGVLPPTVATGPGMGAGGAMPWSGVEGGSGSGSGSLSFPPHVPPQSALLPLPSQQSQPQPPPQPQPEEIQQPQQSVTMIGSWKRDMTGGGGTGEGGRGMFDDYEEDEDDY
ncbi:hypothetical protein I305_04326 [Cryptococcus gattii E566]|uniref:Transcription factor CBF/NF-Y/archaeal histone domain-containing protein n=2 Tax=Cryptococcus gattii TaxID=37769 RepID=E6R686_CRYGW|nr:Hypothetical protein CGB_E6590W [Cryptococcus gattii WM276]ADV22701.1 Hypothetical protein CGB_E6590W [Cryptococcus gattii WM276]KIR78309.1 hypothetical protein I306_04751 [Cryptococcus gattii EJB2]KIY32999.1 hypothetical protein I305_04326 [Cryptococcus gattii E566]